MCRVLLTHVYHDRLLLTHQILLQLITTYILESTSYSFTVNVCLSVKVKMHSTYSIQKKLNIHCYYTALQMHA